jgi:hypothetical protein
MTELLLCDGEKPAACSCRSVRWSLPHVLGIISDQKLRAPGGENLARGRDAATSRRVYNITMNIPVAFKALSLALIGSSWS